MKGFDMADIKRDYTRLVRKNRGLHDVVDKVKLWPTRSGVLHGVRVLRKTSAGLEIETHCGLTIYVNDSKHGRAKRQLRHGYYKCECRKCRIPDWKIEKFKKSF